MEIPGPPFRKRPNSIPTAGTHESAVCILALADVRVSVITAQLQRVEWVVARATPETRFRRSALQIFTWRHDAELLSESTGLVSDCLVVLHTKVCLSCSLRNKPCRVLSSDAVG